MTAAPQRDTHTERLVLMLLWLAPAFPHDEAMRLWQKAQALAAGPA